MAMSFTPFKQMNLRAVPAGAPSYGVITGALQLAKNQEHPTYVWSLMLFSVLSHLAIALVIALALFILSYFGLNWPAFNPAALQQKDIQFILVDVPEQPPRDKNTRNRADRASRSGGKKTAERPTELPQRKAGSTAARPTPAVQQQQPSPTPRRTTQPRQQQQPRQQAQPQPRPQPAPQPARPTPPRPSTQAPKANTKAPVAPPSPSRSTIRTPSAPTPSGATGPVLPTPRTGGGSSGSRATGPTQISGGYGAQSRPGQPGSPGNVGGSGGTGRENRYGAAGGGGGAPGIDALPEPDYGSYMAELQRRIKRNWRPPKAQEDKRVVVLFRIARDGRLLSLSVKVSSGYSEADEAAMGAVRLSSPFRPLPAGHREADLPVEFTFDYNVYRSR